jgi:hypothetical protein
MHIDTVIFGWLLFKNITTSRMRGMEKVTAAITYIRMRVPIIYGRCQLGSQRGY